MPEGSVGQPVGSQSQTLQQKATTYELLVEDTGANTNPERWLNDNHWEPDAEITIAVVGAGGEEEVGDAVEGEAIVCEYSGPRRLKKKEFSGTGDHRQWRIKIKDAYCVIEKKFRWLGE